MIHRVDGVSLGHVTANEHRGRAYAREKRLRGDAVDLVEYRPYRREKILWHMCFKKNPTKRSR